MNKPLVDIFSRKIDNYGDLSIPLRLALFLSKYVKVRLFLSFDFTTKKIISLNKFQNNVSFFDINRTNNIEFPSKNIISIFNTLIPDQYLKKIQDKSTILINYDYFSAEEWTNEYHLMESPIDQRYKKIYFYPGFGFNRGFLYEDKYKISTINNKSSEKLRINFFSYFKKNFNYGLRELDSLDVKISCFFYDYKSNYLPRTQNLEFKKKHFVSFSQFDADLQQADINFIRGEDSLVRAILAGQIFIWQPYTQDQNIHLIKLSHFLKIFFLNELPYQLRKIFFNWSEKFYLTSNEWNYLIKNLNMLRVIYLNARNRFLLNGSLVDKIVKYFY